VRTTRIVFLSPGFDKLFCLGQRFKPMHVEAFIAKVPLNDSMNTLSVGLPGREKSIFALFW